MSYGYQPPANGWRVAAPRPVRPVVGIALGLAAGVVLTGILAAITGLTGSITTSYDVVEFHYTHLSYLAVVGSALLAFVVVRSGGPSYAYVPYVTVLAFAAGYFSDVLGLLITLKRHHLDLGFTDLLSHHQPGVFDWVFYVVGAVVACGFAVRMIGDDRPIRHGGFPTTPYGGQGQPQPFGQQPMPPAPSRPWPGPAMPPGGYGPPGFAAPPTQAPDPRNPSASPPSGIDTGRSMPPQAPPPASYPGWHQQPFPQAAPPTTDDVTRTIRPEDLESLTRRSPAPPTPPSSSGPEGPSGGLGGFSPRS